MIVFRGFQDFLIIFWRNVFDYLITVFDLNKTLQYYFVTIQKDCFGWNNNTLHSHKKRKDSLEGSLFQVVFEAALEFPKILVPRLTQNTSNVNIESIEKSKQLHYLCDKLLWALIYLNFIVLILICFYWLCLV